MKQKILIINKKEFGYHTDSFKYCQYLKDEFDITYICFDTGHKKIIEEGVEVLYYPHKGTFLQRGLGFILFCKKFIKNNNIDLIFGVYFQMISLLRVSLPFHKFILDIRSGSVNQNRIKRKRYDRIMRYESWFFQHITIISECLREKLELKKTKCHILPLGADIFSETDKVFDCMYLLYVGTLNSRNIQETVEGLSIFLKTVDKNIDISYDIFGNGAKEEETKLKQMIIDKDLEDIVVFHGRKNHEELKPYFDRCNIGISYIPIIDYFQCQPPTKTYEYVNSGLVCLATATKENIKLISHNNGILCDDNPKSFADGLTKFFRLREEFDSTRIRLSLKQNNWDNIINLNLFDYFRERLK